MYMVGMLVGVENGIQTAHVGPKELIAQIGGRVDQNGCGRTVRRNPFHENGAAPAPVLGICRIAGAPADAHSWNARR
jgi:hypothetical protein